MRSRQQKFQDEYLIAPDPRASGLTRQVEGVDHTGRVDTHAVIEERPLTIFLNSTEIVTAMTIGDYPDLLALGFLYNQGMLSDASRVTGISFDRELETVVVRTAGRTGYEEKLGKRIRTSGCAVGTVFEDMFDLVASRRLPDAMVKTSWLYQLARKINQTPSLYLTAGAIHGTVLCERQMPLVYMEDVGRHNAVDKIAGWIKANNVETDDKILYTTGRLTSEMILKTAMMNIPVLVSRSGFTAWGVEIARQVDLTLIGRMRGKRYICLSGSHRLVTDADPGSVPEEHRRHRRRAARRQHADG